MKHDPVDTCVLYPLTDVIYNYVTGLFRSNPRITEAMMRLSRDHLIPLLRTLRQFHLHYVLWWSVA